MSPSWIGHPVGRKEDRRLVRGEGRYVGDVPVADALHAAVLRSPLAHARILLVDVERARQLPGVVAVVGAADIGAMGLIPQHNAPRPGLRPAFQPPIPRDRVRYVGEPLAVVVARDRYVAEDALEAIEARLDPLPAVVDSRSAASGLVLHDALGSNVADRIHMSRGEPDRMLREAPRRLRASFAVQRHTGIPMEPRGLVASFDPGSGVLTVWGATKLTQRVRSTLAELLDYPERLVRLIETDVGGGFGLRGEFYPEDFLIPWLAMRLRAPVRWTEDRREHFLATNHSREQWHEVEVGFAEDGRLLALVDRGVVDLGAYVRPNAFVAPERTAGFLPGPYRIEHFDIELACVLTNKTPAGSYRGPGRVESTFVRERVLDLVARELERDPAEVRRRNLVTAAEMPYCVGTAGHDGRPIVYDSGDYPAALAALLDAFSYTAAREAQTAARQQGRYLGIGLGCAVDSSGVGPWETARVAVDGSGALVLYTGLAALGQGTETMLAQICAEELCVTPDEITVIHGDTALVPFGIGTGASRGAVVGGSAALRASRALREKIVALAAHLLEAAPADLVLQAGQVSVHGFPARALTLRDLARAALPGRGLPEAMEPGLEASALFVPTAITYPYGMDAALVEVDVETGQVRVLRYVIVCEVGRAINPMIVEGQIVGGFVQGIGGALLEELAYDGHGQLLTTTFMDYLLPTASDVPASVTVHFRDDGPSPHNPLGAKGAGEGGVLAVPAAIANAVEDALQPFGVTVNALPISPDRVLGLLREGPLQLTGGRSARR